MIELAMSSSVVDLLLFGTSFSRVFRGSLSTIDQWNPLLDSLELDEETDRCSRAGRFALKYAVDLYGCCLVSDE